jgi:dihydrofolate reductase
MKVVLYMASTVNGFIAKGSNETPWSNEEWKSYIEKVQEFGCIIIGRKTYDIMKKYDKFNNIKNPFTIVLSNQDITEKSSNFAFVKTTEVALSELKKKGFKKVLVAGGGEINSLFLQQNLISEMYLDIEPFIFGKGINLFKECDFEAKLELISTKQLSKDTIQLYYKIIN